MDDIKDLKKRILTARAWARMHFNADREGDGIMDDNLNLLPPKFVVEFPDVDRMTATPSVFGEKLSLTYEYRLKFLPDGRMAWQGKHPFYGYELSPMIVEE